MKFVVAGSGFGDILILIEKNKKNFEFIGFIDDEYKNKEKLKYGYPLVGNFEYIKNKNIYVFNGIARNNSIRKKAKLRLDEFGANYINLIDQNIKLIDVILGDGIALFPDVFIGPGVKIGSHTVIHTGSVIAHDSQIGENCFIAPGVKILGGVKISDNCYIGANAVILPNIIINENSTIGANSLVIKNVESSEIIIGVPGRKFFNNMKN